MGNSIRTSSKNTTSTLATNQTTFDIGDVVLCPSLSIEPFTLTADPYGKRNDLTLAFDGSYHYYNVQGYFVKASDTETGDHQPSLFHDTPANRQAVNTLYGNTSTSTSSQRKVIDTTSADDKEAVLINSFVVSNNACEAYGAAETMDDISSLLGLIYTGKVCEEDAKSLARLTQTTVDTWAEILHSQVERVNEILALTKFSKVGE